MKSGIRIAACLFVFVLLSPVADAQRTSAGKFEGVWKGTLNMDVIYDVPEAAVQRLSKPVGLELRIFSRGSAEIYFTFEENEWEMQEQRNFRITPINENSAVIEARIRGNIGWVNSFAFNLARNGDDALTLSWSRLTVRDNLNYDGLDEMGFFGVTELTRAD